MPEGHANICGMRIRYRVSPRDETKPPLLICNGIGQSLDELKPLVSPLSRQVITFDTAGTGGSEVPFVPATVGKHCRIAIGLLDYLGYEQVDVMGISWGGGPAQQLARSYPERCRKLILAVTCAGGITYIPGSVRVLGEMLFPTRHLSKRRRRKVLPMIFGGDARHNPSVISGLLGASKKPSLYGYYSQMLVARTWTSIHWLHRLKQPTLVISGREDPLIPPINQKLLACLIPNARLQSYDCGHLVLSTRRDQVNSDIEKFLDH